MIANLLVGGIAAGSLYAMVGIAIVVVLNITDIANFAQGEMAMLTTFFAYWLLQNLGLSWWQATPLALLFGLAQGIAISTGRDPAADRRADALGHHRDAWPQYRPQQHGRHDLGPRNLYVPFALRVLSAVPHQQSTGVGRQRGQYRRSPGYHHWDDLFLHYTWTGLGMRAAS